MTNSINFHHSEYSPKENVFNPEMRTEENESVSFPKLA